MPELLPVPLTLPRPTNVGGASSSRNGSRGSGLDGDDFETYGSLNDFRKMMSDLGA